MSGLYKRVFITICSGFLMNACTPIIDNYGFMPSDTKINQISIAQTDKEDTKQILGAPSSVVAFDDNTWLYISGKQKRFAFYPTEEVERNVLEIKFAEDGTVKSLEKYDIYDGVKNITFAKKETPTSGHKMGVIEQLLGNVGRFENSSDPGVNGL